MITTTVIWPQDGQTRNPTLEQVIELSTMATTLSSETSEALTSILDTSGNSVIATRQWPNLETAQAWVDYVLANFNASSAVIDPE
jgi:predicted solute-binding protein